MHKIPNNFLWGASTSAYQVEGGFDQDGKGLNMQDLHVSKPEITDFKVASDHYNNYKEDVALMAEMGFKSYRFSISWTRIIPNGNGEVNPLGIEFYNNLINELVKYKIEPIVTMFHFDPPVALLNVGGWNNREIMIDAFAKYSKVLFENFGDRVKHWLTINEQNMMIMFGHVLGLTKITSGVDPFKELYQQNHNMMVAQARAIKLCHELVADGKIGPAPNIAITYAASSSPEDNLAAQSANAIRNWLYLDLPVFGRYNHLVWSYFEENGYTPVIEKGDMELIQDNKPDFIAFNYYTSMTVKKSMAEKINWDNSDQQISFNLPSVYDVVKNENLDKTDFGWTIDPKGFIATSREIYSRYNLPIIITENGLGAKDVLTEDEKVHDDYRIDFLRQHIACIPQIINEGIELFGYNPWSAIDLVSTHEGISKRYGFVYVNRDENDLKDMRRIKKDSFFWYQKVIKSNGTDLD